VAPVSWVVGRSRPIPVRYLEAIAHQPASDVVGAQPKQSASPTVEFDDAHGSSTF
jgi:hypothetical protein